VLWLSVTDETSDVDIQSVDDEGEEVYIEVKSSSGVSQHAVLSARELLRALRHGPNYWLYRVSRVGTRHIEVVVYVDPVRLWRQGRLGLSIESARVIFSVEA
jgi:hypothetical protein